MHVEEDVLAHVDIRTVGQAERTPTKQYVRGIFLERAGSFAFEKNGKKVKCNRTRMGVKTIPFEEAGGRERP